MSTNEFTTDFERYSPFDYLPSGGEVLAALREAHDNGEYLSDVIEAFRTAPLPSDRQARKRAIAGIRQEGLMAQWHAEDLRRLGDAGADDVYELARMVSQAASVYGTMRPGVQRIHDEVELEISQNLHKSDRTTDEHWVAFARDIQAVHGEVHKAFQVPSTIEVAPVPVLENAPHEIKNLPGSGMNKKQQIAATALATAILSGVFPSVAHAAVENTSSRPESVRPIAETANSNDPGNPANLRALAAPQTTSAIDKNSQGETDAKTVSTHTVVQEDVLADLTPAVLPVAEIPAAPRVATTAGTPDVALPSTVAGLDLIPAPVNATPKSPDSAPDAGGTPEVALPVAPALPPVEAVPVPAPVPAPAPTAKAPEAPIEAPKAPEVVTPQSDFLQAAQDMIHAGGIWERRGVAMNFFIDKGLSPAQAAGVVGNLLGESGSELNPGRSQVGGPAFGIAQWEAGRLTALRVFGGDNYADLNVQLNFIWHEFTTSESNALTAIKSTTTRQDAAVAMRAMYERPSVHRDAERIAYANEVGDQFNVYYRAILAKRAPVAETVVDKTPEKVGNVFYTNQLDPAFNDMKYEDGKLVGLTACGGASLDMVANTIGNKPGHGVVMRTMLADGVLPEGGTSQTYIMNEAPKFGLRTEYIQDYSIAAMKKVLDAGGLITFSGRTGSQLLPFPGHFVVVYNVNAADGTIQVADPGNPVNNGKFFSLQAEVTAGAADKAKGNMGLHNGFIAYYPAHVVAVTASQITPKVAPGADANAPENSAPVETESISPSPNTPANTSVATGDSAAQQAVDRAKRAVAAAKAATEQVQREKTSVK